MKKLSLVIALLCAASLSQAATTNTSKFDVRVPIKNWLKKMNDGFRVGIAQGTLNTNTRLRGGSSSSAPGFEDSTQDDSRTKIQLHAGWERIRTKEIGYSAFATYQDLAGEDEDVRNMRLSGNATYGIDKQLYVYGGLNWGKYFGSEQIEANVDSGIGMQAGVGAKIIDKLNLELEYLILQNEGRIDNFNVDIETKGILLKINTPFTFNI